MSEGAAHSAMIEVPGRRSAAAAAGLQSALRLPSEEWERTVSSVARVVVLMRCVALRCAALRCGVMLTGCVAHMHLHKLAGSHVRRRCTGRHSHPHLPSK